MIVQVKCRFSVDRIDFCVSRMWNHYAIETIEFLFLPPLPPDSLNVRILLLIRDPRGLLQSRKHRVWCPGSPDCDNPNIACKDMVSDYKAAVVLAKKFPMTFK